MRSGERATFVVGSDYHLGDLLWLTAVLKEFRRQREPAHLEVSVPDRDVSRILEGNPLVDELTYRSAEPPPFLAGVYDLRVLPVALGMIRGWRRRLPWLYYADLWLEPRGQWLATYLGLGRMESYKPVLSLLPDDFETADSLSTPYVVLAPHIGSYSIPIAGSLWRRIKGWDNSEWVKLAVELEARGFATVTLGVANQPAIAGTLPLLGLPIRQAAAVIGRAATLVTGESGLWFVAAALDVPFVIIPWWLPPRVDWPGAMQARAERIPRDRASVEGVLDALGSLGVESSRMAPV